MAQHKTPKEVFDSLQRSGGSAVLVDVRSPDEYKEEHASSAINVPLPALSSSVKEFMPYKEVYMICHSGMRSAAAAEIFEKMGQWATVANVEGGTTAWKEAGLPVVSE